jgi:putative transposase
MLKAVKVRIYPTEAQQAHLAQAFGCARWVWNQSLATMTATYQETGKGVTAMSMKKCIPLWKSEFEWLSECYSQCLQQSVLNLGVAFRNFFDGRAGYPTFKKRQGKQSIQYPANVKVLGNTEIKFPGKLDVVKAIVHRSIAGEVRTVTVSKNPDGKYFASILVEDGIEKPDSNSDGDVIGIDLGITDFAVTSNGSKYQHPRATKKHEKNLARQQKNFLVNGIRRLTIVEKQSLQLLRFTRKSNVFVRIFLRVLSRKIVDENFRHSSRESGSKKHGEKPLPSQSNF